jgi:Fe-S cluster assembly iron-binding protein IscA
LYSPEFDSELQARQEVNPDFQVAVDVKSYLYLNGPPLCHRGLTGGFTFVNPQAKSTCGCGTSFSA